MILEGGDTCSDNFHRTTVINFLCNENAGKCYLLMCISRGSIIYDIMEVTFKHFTYRWF